MNTKAIILLLILHFHNTLMCMEITFENLTNDNQKEIFSFVIPSQWWYLDKTFEHDHYVHSVCFNPAGTLLATGCEDNKAYIFDIQTNKEIASFQHDDLIRSVCFNHAGTHLATGCYDEIARIFDIQTKKEITSFKHDNRVVPVCFNHTDTHLATGCEYGKTRIFDIKTNREVASFNHERSVLSVCFNPSDTYLAITYSNFDLETFYRTIGEAHIFDIQTNTEVAYFKHNKNVTSACFNPSGTHFATGCEDNKARIFDVQTKTKIASFNHKDLVKEVCFNHLGTQLATACHDKKAHIFDIHTNTEVASFKHDNDNGVCSVCFDPSSTLLATACFDKKARIFKKYELYTYKQLLLKKLLLNWLLIEKPDKQIDTLKKLLADLAQKNNISDELDLTETWSTFPENMQTALWRTMLYKITQYGKISYL